MKHNYKIENDEIVLRPLEERDIELVRKWRNTDSIRKSFIYQEVISAPQQKKWYEKYSNDISDIMFIIEYKREAVGAVALYNIENVKKTVEFGRLMIGEKSARGKKLGQAVTKMLSNYALTTMGLEKVVLEVYEDNHYALNGYKDAGFKIVSICVKNDRKVLFMQKMRDDIDE